MGLRDSGLVPSVDAEEGICTYRKRFSISDWPRGLLEGRILDHARRRGARKVVAVMSATTDYSELIRRVPWERAGFCTKLVVPIAEGGGAQGKVPRAQGQAISALVGPGLEDGWRSTDGLAVRVECLGVACQ